MRRETGQDTASGQGRNWIHQRPANCEAKDYQCDSGRETLDIVTAIVLIRAIENGSCAQLPKPGRHGQYDSGEPEEVFYTLEHVRLPGSSDQDHVSRYLYLAFGR